jgi:hypothetical protein
LYDFFCFVTQISPDRGSAPFRGDAGKINQRNNVKSGFMLHGFAGWLKNGLQRAQR